LVEVAVGRGTGEQWVYCTGFTHAPESVSPTRVVYASARTALAQSGLLP
jgi:hypothetical protein